MFSREKNQLGFSLLELMIVVAIVGLLASISVPRILRVRMDANEQAMVASLKTFVTANETYKGFVNPPVYADSIATLVSEGYLDDRWSGSAMFGFQMGDGFYERTDDTYSFVAIPEERTYSAINDYCVEHTGKMIKSADGIGVISSTAGCSGGVVLGG